MMLCKCFKKCFFVLIFAVSVLGKMELNLTPDQKARINNSYYNEDLNNETSIDKRSRFLYKIIHSRPENLDIPIDIECKMKLLKMPDFAALKEHNLGISDVKCLEHLWKIRYYEEISTAQATCDVGSDNNQIENEVKLHIPDGIYSEHPHMGAVGWEKSNETWIFLCEGALISERHVLTAASCTQLPERYTNKIFNLKPKVVRFGVYDISDKEQLGKSPMDVLISKVITYPRYKPHMYYYDIALIQIDKKLIFSSMIHPACIWTNTTSLTDTGLLTGWYDVISNKTVKTKQVIRTSDIDVFDMIELLNQPKPVERIPNTLVNKVMMQLKKVLLTPDMLCEKLTRNKRGRKWHGLLYSQQCGFSRRSEKTCELERGTVLQARITIPEITDWTMHYVFGVRSGDLTCDMEKRLSIYTKASVYINWIEKIVWPEDYHVRYSA